MSKSIMSGNGPRWVKRMVWASAVGWVSTTLVVAGPLTFDFKDPKGVNNVVFKLDAPLEAISGSANGIGGTITFDPTNPAVTRGKIVVTSASMTVGNPMMKEHMHSAQWMDAGKHQEITFEVRELRQAKTTGDTTEAQAVGALTLKGQTKELTVPVKLTYLKDKLGARTNGQAQGDLLVVRANFTVKRSEFGINPKAPEDKVADAVELTLSLAGAAPR